MRKVSVFVRPTHFDGDATSVREALALGVPVVASDTDFRPEGVMLFRRGDVDDLMQKLGQAFGRDPTGLTPSSVADTGSFEQLLAIYRGLAPAASARSSDAPGEALVRGGDRENSRN